MTDLADALSDMPHRRIDLPENAELFEGSPHRPEVSVWAAGGTDDEPPHVVLQIGDLWGQQARYVELLPAEAEKLARLLNETANTVEAHAALR